MSVWYHAPLAGDTLGSRKKREGRRARAQCRLFPRRAPLTQAHTHQGEKKSPPARQISREQSWSARARSSSQAPTQYGRAIDDKERQCGACSLTLSSLGCA
ncbi:hypothetical protein FKM82_023930 [Ascaphus truei]